MPTMDELRNAPCITPIAACSCGAPVTPLVSAPFYVRWHDGSRVDLPTVLYYCAHCDLTIRGLDYRNRMVLSHFELATYTDLDQEAVNRGSRGVFFQWLWELAVKGLGRAPESVLDFGSSYGHLLDVAADRGAATIAVEVTPHIVAKLRREGRHRVYESVPHPEIAPNSVDAVFVIDSLYLAQDAGSLLNALAETLRPGGVMITRTTNRNAIHRMASWWHRLGHGTDQPAPISYRLCGDAKLGFSERALVPRLAKAGLRRVAAYRSERKPVSPVAWIRNGLALAAYHATLRSVDLCTGVVLVSRKTGPAASPTG